MSSTQSASKAIRLAVLAAAFLLATCSAQTLRVGGVIGTPFTKGIARLPDWNEIKPISGGLIGGPMIDLGFDSGLAIEVNAIHRTIGYDYYNRFVDGTRSPWLRANIGIWQFPVLLKYTVPLRGRIRPLVEAGPSFRAIRNKAGTEPSAFGFTAGAGAEMRLGKLSVAPVLRFTRWGGERYPYRPTVHNQIEFLTSLSLPAARLSPPAESGRKMRFGFLAGIPLTDDFRPAPFPRPSFPSATTRTADFRSVAGLMTELNLSQQLAIEVNGLYRRLHFTNGPEVVVTWQIPVLAKYRLRAAGITPVLQAGPSFRLAGNLNGTNPSHVGVTAGGGVEFPFRRVKLSPALRYTRWQARDETKPGQVELVVGISF